MVESYQFSVWAQSKPLQDFLCSSHVQSLKPFILTRPVLQQRKSQAVHRGCEDHSCQRCGYLWVRGVSGYPAAICRADFLCRDVHRQVSTRLRSNWLPSLHAGLSICKAEGSSAAGEVQRGRSSRMRLTGYMTERALRGGG